MIFYTLYNRDFKFIYAIIALVQKKKYFINSELDNDLKGDRI